MPDARDSATGRARKLVPSKRATPGEVRQQPSRSPSLSWAPGAGIAKGMGPSSHQARTLAKIKAQEWAKFEPGTLFRAINAWNGWVQFLAESNTDAFGTKPKGMVILWINRSKARTGPRTAYSRLSWLVNRAGAPIPLTTVTKACQSQSDRVLAHDQAVVAEPFMLVKLEILICTGKGM